MSLLKKGRNIVARRNDYEFFHSLLGYAVSTPADSEGCISTINLEDTNRSFEPVLKIGFEKSTRRQASSILALTYKSWLRK